MRPALKVVALRPKLEENIDVLTKHFGAQMYQLESKMNRLLSALDLLEKRCGGIADAVDKWEFAGEPWVALPKDKADQEILTAFRLVEQFNNQFDNLKVTYSALADRKDHQPQKLKDHIVQTSNMFELGNYSNRLEAGKKIVALWMITNAILTSATPKDKSTWPNVCSKTIKHLKEKMQFDIKSSMPANLLPCIAEEGKGGGSGSAASASQNPKLPVAVAAEAKPDVKQAAQEQIEPEKKRRRFSSTKQ